MSLRSARRWFLILLLPIAAAALWGLFEPRLWLDERTVQARVPGLPADWENKRIAVIADLQIGMWLSNETMIRRAIGRIVRERPAAVLLGGDYLYKPIGEETIDEAREELKPDELRELRGQVARVIELLGPLLAAKLPVYAVLGNHDYLKDVPESVTVARAADEMAQALRQAGVTVLRNQAVDLGGAAGPLYLGGIDSAMAGRAEPARMLAAIPEGAPRIVLMHNPDSFAQLPARSAPLVIAGHTHGGQIRLPGLPHWSWLTLKQPGRVTADGWIVNYGEAGNRLYVNRGLGFSLIPVRINCPPELTWVELRSTGAQADR